MSDTTVLDRPTQAPTTSRTIDLDAPELLGPLTLDAMLETAALEQKYAMEAAETGVHFSQTPPAETSPIDLREVAVATLCYGMDVVCQVIAVGATLLPFGMGRPITRPLVARIMRKPAVSR